MDADRFDALARALSAAGHRCSVLGLGLGLGLLGSLGSGAVAAGARPGRRR